MTQAELKTITIFVQLRNELTHSNGCFHAPKQAVRFCSGSVKPAKNSIKMVRNRAYSQKLVMN